MLWCIYQEHDEYSGTFTVCLDNRQFCLEFKGQFTHCGHANIAWLVKRMAFRAFVP